MKASEEHRPLSSQPNRIVAAFPITTVLALEYALLAIWPAWHFHNPRIHFILDLTLFGLLAAFVGEAVVAPLRRTTERVNPSSVVTVRGAKMILVFGFASAFGSAALGARTYATQVGATQTSGYAVLFTPFIVWIYVGSALLLYCWVRGDISRREIYYWLGGAGAAFLGYGFITGLTGQVVPFGMGVAVTMLLTGFFKLRHVAIVAAIGLLLWPTIFNVRNSLRAEVKQNGTYGAEISANDRLREDLLLGTAQDLPPGLNLGQPTVSEMIRYGIVPSVLDPFPRPDLNTSKLLSSRLGLGADNSMTLTIFGNIRTLGGGTLPMMLIIGGLAASLSLIRRSITPARLALVSLSTMYVFWIEATWPDAIAGILQALVATAIAFGLMRFFTALNAGLARAHARGPATTQRKDAFVA